MILTNCWLSVNVLSPAMLLRRYPEFLLQLKMHANACHFRESK